jgi:HEAT repeat protein
MALNALMQMSSEQAVPLLRQVLARRDACSAPLREKAVFLLSQHRGAGTEDLMLSIVQEDPDPKVREQAVFWLSQIPSERSLAILQQILRTSNDNSLREKALFAVSQHPGDQATAVLRGVAEQSSLSPELRGKAIFWLSQKPSAETAAYLRALYGRLDSAPLKENALFALSQMGGENSGRWLIEVALDRSEPLDARKKALFWAGQTDMNVAQLSDLYERLTEREMREQVIFVLSQRQDRAAVDRLLAIARSESDPELRRKAIFWLGQSRDPRVPEFLMTLINQP